MRFEAYHLYYSWSYDGSRQRKFYNEEGEPFGEEWSQGDIIGCWINLSEPTEIRYYRYFNKKLILRCI